MADKDGSMGMDGDSIIKVSRAEGTKANKRQTEIHIVVLATCGDRKILLFTLIEKFSRTCNFCLIIGDRPVHFVIRDF